MSNLKIYLLAAFVFIFTGFSIYQTWEFSPIGLHSRILILEKECIRK